MKKLCLTAAAVWIVTGGGAWAVALRCLTSADCANVATTFSPYCCNQYTTGQSYNCPDGWTYQIPTGKCSRPGTTNGSDDAGSYQLSYGDCDPKITTHNCFEPSSSSTDKKGMLCFQVSTVE